MANAEQTNTAAPVTTMALPAPVSGGGILTGVSTQAHAAPGVQKLASQAYMMRCQRTAATLNREKKRAEAAVADAVKGYDQAVAAIVVPSDFIEDLLKVVVPLRVFYADVVATNASDVPFVAEKKRRKKAGSAPVADAEDVDEEVGPSVTVASSTQFSVSGKIRSGGRDLFRVSRMYELPESVTQAAKVLADTKTEVNRIDSELASVRTQMTKANEVGDLAVANMTATQLAQTEEGRQILQDISAVVGQIGDEAGLESYTPQIGAWQAIQTTPPRQNEK